jgi:hypothetical protein
MKGNLKNFPDGKLVFQTLLFRLTMFQRKQKLLNGVDSVKKCFGTAESFHNTTSFTGDVGRRWQFPILLLRM